MVKENDSSSYFLSIIYFIIFVYVRAVRAMNESLKQNRLLREQGASGSYSFGPKDQHNAGQPEDVCFLLHVTTLMLCPLSAFFFYIVMVLFFFYPQNGP